MGFNKVRISLRVKMIASITVLILMTTVVLNVFFANHEKVLILDNLELKALDITGNLAYNSEYYLLTGDRKGLQKLVGGVMQHPDVVYCVVSNVQGDILAAEGWQKEGPDKYKPLQGQPLVPGKHRENIRHLEDARGTVYFEARKSVLVAGRDAQQDELGLFLDKDDTAIALDNVNKFGQQIIGVIRVGLSSSRAMALLEKAHKTSRLLTLIIVIFSGIVTVIVAEIVLRPVQELMKGTHALSEGSFDVSVKVKSNDELGDLAWSFNRMVNELKKSTVSIEVLEEARQRFEDIADNTGDWIWETDAKGVYTYSSPVALKVTGYRPEELIGRYFYDFFIPEKSGIGKNKALEHFSEKKIFVNFENQFVKKDGKIIILETTGIPVVDRAGNLQGYRGVDRDITARKNTEIALIENVQLKTDFTSMVSHELRTPLTAIREGIGIVLEGSAGSVNNEQADFLGTAKRNVDRLSRLINSVLDFTKLEAGKVIMRIEENNIGEVINEAIQTNTLDAKERGLQIRSEIDPNIPLTKFDLDRITQVLINLVSNAIKFTDEGDIVIFAELLEGKVRVSVEDTGTGIAAEEIPKLFEEFHQIEDSNRRKTGGTGLGLAISKKIIRQHGGKIWVESEPGKGSKFIFEIPG